MLYDVRLSDSGESKKPQNTIRHSFQYITPDVENVWINLVELVKVTEDDSILWQTILLARSHHWVHQNLKQNITN